MLLVPPVGAAFLEPHAVGAERDFFVRGELRIRQLLHANHYEQGSLPDNPAGIRLYWFGARREDIPIPSQAIAEAWSSNIRTFIPRLMATVSANRSGSAIGAFRT